MNNKQIVELIKKMAKDTDQLGDMPLKNKPAPNSTAQTSITPSSSNFIKIPEVIKMQEALINLSNVVMAQMNVKNLGTEHAAQGKTSFNDFVVKNYMRDSGEGVESNADPNAIKYDKSTQTGPNRMLSIMNTMSRVGGTNVKAQFIPDGKWGPKTNDALHNAKAFAISMLKLAKDFNFTPKSYAENNLSEFAIPKEYTSWNNEQKRIAASALTKHIDNIKSMFEEIKKNVLESSENKEYIENKRPYVTYKKVIPLKKGGPTDSIIALIKGSDKLARYDIPFSVPQPGRPDNMLNVIINYKDLLSTKDFDSWLNDGGKVLKETNVPRANIINAIRNKIKSTRIASDQEQSIPGK